ncbi:MAG: hypothetical protein JWN50_230, partial [Parcubacteria group bacterium]|nr:hypothetical protein [Parcubacteria group bacterium]
MMEIERDIRPASRSSRYILTFLWSFAFGVLLSSFVPVSPVISLSFIFLAGAIYLAEKVYRKEVPTEIIFIIIALTAFGLGAFRYAIKDFHDLQSPSEIGMVASEPEHRDTDTRFVFEGENGEKVLVSTDMYSHVQYGDEVKVSGKLERPGVIVDEETGRSFDYGAYLSKDDIYYTMSFAKVGILAGPTSADSRSAPGKSRPMSVRLVSILLRIKNAFVGKMKQILPEPESSLLAGLIVAGKQALPSAILDDFKKAGVVHIVVLSGYNITVVAEFFLAMLAFLPLRRRAIVSALAIALFVLMTGATATVVRAGIMAMIVLLGKVIHRKYSAPRTLLLAAVLMLMENPKLLVFDPSFQLTFLAMLALIYVEPIVSARLTKLAFVSLLSTTIATQLTVLPYLLYSVGSVSIVSLLSNI